MIFRLLGPGMALGLCALALPAWGNAPELRHPTALRLTAGDAVPVIDGRLEAARWRTTVQVLVTEDALIFGIRAWDPDPGRIRAPLARRDQV